MNNLQSLIQNLAKQGYKQISLPELAFHYKRQFKASIDIQQLRKALIQSGFLGHMISEDNIVTLTATPIVAHFNKLPQNETIKVLRN
jgi:hypothetical protein